MFNEKTILITGGTGTIGSFLVSKLIRTKCKKIIIFSRDENKQFKMQNIYSDSRIEYIIGDIRNYQLVESTAATVDYVIHTAAMKQVSIAEKNPLETSMTNIIGTNNIITASIKQHVKKVICISTDKAVCPSNCMGMTKGIAERLVKNSINNICATDVVAIRLGNVIGSRGSVIPTWKDQMLHNQKITLTSENMTRFIMTNDDVYNLLMHAFSKGYAGEIIVPNMTVCNIADLARCFCNHYGLSYENDVIISGMRKGEKMFEEIFSSEEIEYLYQVDDYYHISNKKQANNISVPRKSYECIPMNIDEIDKMLCSKELYI